MITQQVKMIPIARPLIGEEEKRAVMAVLEGGQLAQGAVTANFEEEFAAFCEAPASVAVSSGTTALHLALLAHGVGPGDEVITSPFTFIASANAVLFCNAKPVFVDIDPITFNIDPNLIEAAITPRTKAIMPVHLYGQSADMAPICEIAARRGIAIIEDAAQAHGAKYNGAYVGKNGTACFSFYPTKNMTTAEGGIVTSDDPEIIDRLRLLRAHGARERYKHEILGFNFRMTDLQAAIGRAQLSHLAEWNARRRHNAKVLSSLIVHSRIVTPTEPDYSESVYHQYTIRVVGGRGDMGSRLTALGVGSSVHYPIPVHHQPLYQDLGYADSLPIAEAASQEVLALPVHPSLSEEDLHTIASAVINAAG